MKKRWSHNGEFSRHWTELDERVVEFLREATHETPKKMDSGKGCDYICGDVSVEIKACCKYISRLKDAHHKTGLRKGRFCFHGHETADFILFVLVEEDNNLKMSLLPGGAIDERIGKKSISITWPRVFPEERDHESKDN